MKIMQYVPSVETERAPSENRYKTTIILTTNTHEWTRIKDSE
jgi:hypothetical protein